MAAKLLTEPELLTLILEGNKKNLLSETGWCEYCEKEIPHFHASQIGYCVRRQQYDILNKVYPKKMAAYTATWLRDGHINEQIIREGLRGSGIKLLTLTSTPIRYKDVIIVMHYDIVIEYKGIQYILEIKSVKDWAWKEITKTGVVPFRYKEQLMLYQEDQKIPHGFVVIKRRMTSEMFPVYVKFEKKVVQNRLKLQQSILDHTKQQKIIARPYKSKKEVECRIMCPYKEPCWSTKE